MIESPTPHFSLQDQQLLAKLSRDQVDLLQRVLLHHPDLTPKKAWKR